MLYNAYFEVVEENTGYLPVDDRINAIQILASDKLVMKEAGFIEIFANNDAQTPVYYDNIRISHTAGYVSEVNAYYPYGTLISGLTMGMYLGGDENNYKFNGKEMMRYDWYNFGARIMDPVVGRWWVPDPMAEKYYHISPYVYCGNNPINYIDPDGQDFIFYLDDEDEEKKKQAFWGFMNMLNNALEGQYSIMAMSVNGGWMVDLAANKDATLSKQGQAFYDNLSGIINDKDVTKVGLVYGSSDAHVGNYNTGQIDVADIGQFPTHQVGVENTVGTQRGKLAHEIGEQYYKQKNNAGWDASHEYGLKQESAVDGLTRMDFTNQNNMYIMPNSRIPLHPDNHIGLRTKYYNPATGTVYLENAILKNNNGSYRKIIQLLPPTKIK